MFSESIYYYIPNLGSGGRGSQILVFFFFKQELFNVKAGQLQIRRQIFQKCTFTSALNGCKLQPLLLIMISSIYQIFILSRYSVKNLTSVVAFSYIKQQCS